MNNRGGRARARRSSEVVGSRTRARISAGGQISIPAAIRHRWATDKVTVEDRGDEILVRPLPADPIAAVMGSVTFLEGLTTDQVRQAEREEEAVAAARRRLA